MVRPGFKERYILPETIHVGDTVRASWVRRDVRASAIGKVASIVADGPTRTFYTEGGEPIFTYVPGARTPTGGKPVRITLLDPSPTRSDAALFEMDDMGGINGTGLVHEHHAIGVSPVNVRFP